MKVDLIYPAGFNLDTKELNISEIEVKALLASKKVGSEGKYFPIEEIIFEDTPGGYSITVILK